MKWEAGMTSSRRSLGGETNFKEELKKKEDNLITALQ